MKIRVKIKGYTARAALDVAEDCSPNGVVDQFAQQSNLRPNEWCVSLNGKDPLEGGSNKSLAELGVVSGDLLWLIPTGPAPGEVDQSVTTVKSCDSAPEEKDQSVTTMKSCDSAPEEKDQSVTTVKSCDSAPEEKDQSVTTVKSCDSAPEEKDQSVTTVKSCDSAPEEMDQSVANVESCDSAPPMVASHVISPRFSEFLTALYTVAAPHTAAEVVLVVGDAVLRSEGLARKEDTAILANQAGTYHIKYTYLGKDCHVVMTTMGRVCVIQAAVPRSWRAVTCQVRPSDYLNPSAALHEGPQQVLLGHTLVWMMRDKLALPLVNTVRAECGQAPKGTLASLSPEEKLKVLFQLDVVSLLRVAATCNELYTLASDRYLWRNLFARDFGPVAQQSVSGQARGQDWKEAYKRMYLSRKASRETRQGETVLIPPSTEYWPYPLDPQFPGVIGGDWDRLPGIRPPQFARDPSSLLRYFGPRRPVLPWQPLPGSRHSSLTVQPPTTRTPLHRPSRQSFLPII